MSENKIIDGKEISEKIRKRIKSFGSELIKTSGRIPGLAVVLVGDNPASRVYVKILRIVLYVSLSTLGL